METKSHAVPISIIIAGLIIAGAVIFNGRETGISKTSEEKNEVAEAKVIGNLEVKKVDSNDHILGSANAQMVFVEYSDTECPFCKQFHATMHSIVDNYGKEGKVAWVYRHFPIAELHKKAAKEAEATECAAELGGNAKFWQYIDRLYSVTPSNDGLDPAKLPEIASDVGLDSAQFNECLSSGKYTEKVADEYDAAVKAGARGTPYTVVILKNKLTEKDKQDIMASLNAAFEKLAPGSNFPRELFSFDDEGDKIIFSGALPYQLLDEGIIKTLLADSQ